MQGGPDAGKLYGKVRARVSDLVRLLGAAELATPAPCCPDWTVQDIAAHLAGAAADFLRGDLAGAATPAWTAAQVAARAGRPIGAILDEWDVVGPQLEAFLGAQPRPLPPLFDVTMHEHDIRGALGLPGARDTVEMELTMRAAVRALGRRISEVGLPAVAVHAEDVHPAPALGERLLAGEGEPGAELAGTRFELARALFGRRSTAQVAGLAWRGDPGPYLPIFSIFPAAATEIVE